jgi:VIT1/CCC1 family predicted Fe2+/Mn2+ transporter
MSEDAYYDKVAQEIQAQTMVPGLWTRAFSEAGGQVDRARALYIKHRVAQLALEASEKLKQKQRAEAQAARRRVAAGFRHIVFGLLAALFALIAFGCLMGVLMPFVDTPRHPISDQIYAIVVCIVATALFGWLTYVCGKASRQ